MSRNPYSLRNRGGDRGSEPPEKRQRTSAVDGSRVLYLGNVPKDWNDDIVRSVVAGSGDIVDIRVRIDPSGRSKNYVFVEYTTPDQAKQAIGLISQITIGERRLRVELSKEGLRAGPMTRPVLQLNRDALPFYVTLPQEMLQRVPPPQNMQQQQQLPQQQQHQPQPQHQAPPQMPIQQVNIPIPDVLAKASQFLPAFNANAFTMEDKISQNLGSLTPPQMIELISTLKTLLASNPNAGHQVFNMAPNIPIATTQALLLMGLIDPNVITTALRLTSPARANATLSAPSKSATPPAMGPQPDPRWPSLPGYVGVKLAKLPAGEADTVAQVLQLSPDVIKTLPEEQKKLVESIRSQYF